MGDEVEENEVTFMLGAAGETTASYSVVPESLPDFEKPTFSCTYRANAGYLSRFFVGLAGSTGAGWRIRISLSIPYTVPVEVARVTPRGGSGWEVILRP